MNEQQKHTPDYGEPWGVYESYPGTISIENAEQLLRVVGKTPDREAEYVKRIVSAVNACAGIPAEALSNGVIGRLILALKETMGNCVGAALAVDGHMGTKADQRRKIASGLMANAHALEDILAELEPK
jgi:hypothetical protein